MHAIKNAGLRRAVIFLIRLRWELKCTHSFFLFSNTSFSFFCSSIRSIRAWCLHLKREGVSILGWVSSSSSDICKNRAKHKFNIKDSTSVPLIWLVRPTLRIFEWTHISFDQINKKYTKELCKNLPQCFSIYCNQPWLYDQLKNTKTNKKFSLNRTYLKIIIIWWW